MENIGNETLHYLEIFNNGTGSQLYPFHSNLIWNDIQTLWSM